MPRYMSMWVLKCVQMMFRADLYFFEYFLKIQDYRVSTAIPPILWSNNNRVIILRFLHYLNRKPATGQFVSYHNVEPKRCLEKACIGTVRQRIILRYHGKNIRLDFDDIPDVTGYLITMEIGKYDRETSYPAK